MTESPHLEGIVPQNLSGQRLDVALADLFGDYSRSRLQQWIRGGQVEVDGQVINTTRQRVVAGAKVTVSVPSEPQIGEFVAENIPLDVCYQDEHIIVIDKPSNLVMHPAVGNREGTVQNALLFHFPGIEQIPRAGIVHRLDKDTTGLFVVARSLIAHASLENGKPAVTHYRIKEKFSSHTYLSVKLETGRTHQIRVHLSHQRHPLVGDSVYGGRRQYAKGFDEQARRWLRHYMHGSSRCSIRLPTKPCVGNQPYQTI